MSTSCDATGGERMSELTTLTARHRSGRVQVVGDLAPALDEALPDDAVFVGLGLDGLVVAATLAAVHGRDVAFVRSHQKEHGTGRVLDGAVTDDRPLVIVTGRQGLALTDRLPSDQVTKTLLLAGPTDAPAAVLPPGTTAPQVPRVDPAEHVHVLEGSFRTSSGFQVSRYVETLQSACTYPVAATFADRLLPGLAGITTICGIAHGGALLAAVTAARRGAVADLFWPHGADGEVAFHQPTCFLDDYIMIGAAQRRACLTVEATQRARSRFIAVYGPVPSVDFGDQQAEVLVVTEGGAAPPPSPSRRGGDSR